MFRTAMNVIDVGLKLRHYKGGKVGELNFYNLFLLVGLK